MGGRPDHPVVMIPWLRFLKQHERTMVTTGDPPMTSLRKPRFMSETLMTGESWVMVRRCLWWWLGIPGLSWLRKPAYTRHIPWFQPPYTMVFTARSCPFYVTFRQISTSIDKSVRFWNVDTGEMLKAPRGSSWIRWTLSGWWFGTFFIFPYIGNFIIPSDFHIFQRGRYTTNQLWTWNKDFYITTWIMRTSKSNISALFQASSIIITYGYYY